MGAYSLGAYSLGAYSLGAYSLGAFNLEAPISGVSTHILVLKENYGGPRNVNVV